MRLATEANNVKLPCVFVGLTTLDVLMSVPHVPKANEKVVAGRQTISAGGPAANAAVTCSALGGAVILATAIGSHPLAAGIQSDLATYGVEVLDARSAFEAPPPLSAIMVTESSGERAVVSINDRGAEAEVPAALFEAVRHAALVLIDGHHPRLAVAAARSAREAGVLTILDGGSWKPVLAAVLPYVDIAVCSGDFRPPDLASDDDVLAYLRRLGVCCAAVTRGPDAVSWSCSGELGDFPVPRVPVVDTLGAGDVFHGALAYALRNAGRPISAEAFCDALKFAASTASESCRSFGTRSWLKALH